jgi:hypothetical protein
MINRLLVDTKKSRVFIEVTKQQLFREFIVAEDEGRYFIGENNNESNVTKIHKNLYELNHEAVMILMISIGPAIDKSIKKAKKRYKEQITDVYKIPGVVRNKVFNQALDVYPEKNYPVVALSEKEIVSINMAGFVSINLSTYEGQNSYPKFYSLDSYETGPQYDYSKLIGELGNTKEKKEKESLTMTNDYKIEGRVFNVDNLVPNFTTRNDVNDRDRQNFYQGLEEVMQQRAATIVEPNPINEAITMGNTGIDYFEEINVRERLENQRQIQAERNDEMVRATHARNARPVTGWPGTGR